MEVCLTVEHVFGFAEKRNPEVVAWTRVEVKLDHALPAVQLSSRTVDFTVRQFRREDQRDAGVGTGIEHLGQKMFRR